MMERMKGGYGWNRYILYATIIEKSLDSRITFIHSMAYKDFSMEVTLLKRDSLNTGTN